MNTTSELRSLSGMRQRADEILARYAADRDADARGVIRELIASEITPDVVERALGPWALAVQCLATSLSTYFTFFALDPLPPWLADLPPRAIDEYRAWVRRWLRLTPPHKRHQTTDTPLCNACGKTCGKVFCDDQIDPNYGLRASVTGGYCSTDLRDLTRYSFSLCEACCVAMFDRFVIPPSCADVNVADEVARVITYAEDRAARQRQ